VSSSRGPYPAQKIAIPLIRHRVTDHDGEDSGRRVDITVRRNSTVRVVRLGDFEPVLKSPFRATAIDSRRPCADGRQMAAARPPMGKIVRVHGLRYSSSCCRIVIARNSKDTAKRCRSYPFSCLFPTYISGVGWPLA